MTDPYGKIPFPYSAPSTGNNDASAADVRKDYMRKIKELKYAITLEKKMTKDQILEGYMNLVYYGDRAYGVEAASQHYFSIPSSKLSLSQAALLAGLTQNPGTTDPVHNPKRAVERRDRDRSASHRSRDPKQQGDVAEFRATAFHLERLA